MIWTLQGEGDGRIQGVDRGWAREWGDSAYGMPEKSIAWDQNQGGTFKIFSKLPLLL